MFRIAIWMIFFIQSSLILAQNALDYTALSLWAAHPEKADMADGVPVASLKDNQATAAVDVFFVHPTTYTKKFINDNWNAPVDDAELNAKTDGSTIKLQASVFNGSARIYAPYYRQAHLNAFFPKKSGDKAKPAFELAYGDVVDAFEQFLKFSNGRPFIIAAHSQGTLHATQLVKAKIDGTDLQNRLVAAYLVGMPVKNGTFENIPVCDDPSDTGCYVAWRTYGKNGGPKKGWRTQDDITVVNPITWTLDTEYSKLNDHQGIVLSKFNKILPAKTTAKIQGNVLWITGPKIFGSFLFGKNWHVADYNMFWMDIRMNVENRVNTFLKLR